jgi:hypothetical protein
MATPSTPNPFVIGYVGPGPAELTLPEGSRCELQNGNWSQAFSTLDLVLSTGQATSLGMRPGQVIVLDARYVKTATTKTGLGGWNIAIKPNDWNAQILNTIAFWVTDQGPGGGGSGA